MENAFRTVLVIGDNHEELIKRYSADTKVDRYVKYRLDDAEKLHREYLDRIKAIMGSKKLNLTDEARENYKALYEAISEMSDFEYYQYLTQGCYYDEETGDALTDENPDAHYKFERCFEQRLRNHGEEGSFSTPFWLNDASRSYSARLNDICWERIHCFGPEMDLYRRAWEIVMDGSEPVNDQERRIRDNMVGKKGYYLGFKDKDEYVMHSCSFWCYGVIDGSGYHELGYNMSDKEWISNFYDKYIKTLSKEENPLLTIYEVRSI